MELKDINFLKSENITETPAEIPETSSKKKIIWYAVMITSALIISAFLLRSLTKNEEVYGATLSPKPAGFFQTVKNFIFKRETVLIGQEDDRVNILLLGIGGSGHDGPYLSDTNIIVSIKPSTNEVALISVPRDLGVKINGQWMKINHANAYGEAESPGYGGEYARKIFEETFQMEIPYYLRVDFKAFQELIDNVGGITVNVPRGFTDTAYPGPNFSYVTVKFNAGEQTMNGETALVYSRSRHGNNGEGSDFARAKRQQLVLEALKEKMLSAGTYTNPVKLQSIYSSLRTHVSTNLNFAQLAFLAGMAKDMNQSKSLVLDNSPSGYLVSTTGESGAFLLFPRTGNFEKINETISLIFEEQSSSIEYVGSTPASTSSTVKIEVENGTWIPGLAARIGKKLEDNKLNVIAVGNSLKRPINNTTIYILTSTVDLKTVKYLSEMLKAANTTTIPDWLKEEYDNPVTPEDERGMKYNRDAVILVILGTDTKE